MFCYTDTADAPWTIVNTDAKDPARLNFMQHFFRCCHILGRIAVLSRAPVRRSSAPRCT